MVKNEKISNMHPVLGGLVDGVIFIPAAFLLRGDSTRLGNRILNRVRTGWGEQPQPMRRRGGVSSFINHKHVDDTLSPVNDAMDDSVDDVDDGLSDVVDDVDDVIVVDRS